MGSLIKSCSIGLADAAKLVVLLSKIDNHDKNTGKHLFLRFMVLTPSVSKKNLNRECSIRVCT